MPRRLFRFVLLAPLVAACGDGDAPEAVPVADTVYDVALAGEGSGEATIRLVPARGEVCYEITTDGVDAPTSAHIHDRSGHVVLDLTAGGPAPWTDCSAADPTLVKRLEAQPERFYVSVHTEASPDGAVRGGLA